MEHKFSLNINKKNPKENAQVYRLETVDDIFQCLTSENIERFLKEFENGMRLGVLMRELAISEAKKDGVELVDDNLRMPSFTWVDD